MTLAERAKNILLQPAREWAAIESEGRSVKDI